MPSFPSIGSRPTRRLRGPRGLWGGPTLALAIFAAAAGCTARDEAQQVVEFWAIGAEGERVLPLVDEFQQRHPGIRIEVQQIPWSAAHEKLLTAFAGDSLPDACQLGNTWISEFVMLGALEDLSPRVGPERAVNAADFFTGAWDANVVDGGVYGVPWYVDTRVLFYRTDLFAAAGWDQPPRTWDDWLAALRAVQQRQTDGDHAILLPVNEWEQLVILALQTDAAMLRDGGRYGDFQSPAFRRAFEFYCQIYSEGLAPRIANTQVTNLVQQFHRGDFASFVSGPWNVAECRRRLPAEMDARWSTAPLPAANGDYPGASMAGGCSLVVFRDTPRREAAWKWIEFLTAAPQQTKFFAASGNLPSCRAAWAAPQLADDARLDAFRQQLESARPLPRVPEWEQIAAKTWAAAESSVNGRATTDDALATLQQQVDAILEKRRWMLAEGHLVSREDN